MEGDTRAFNTGVKGSEHVDAAKTDLLKKEFNRKKGVKKRKGSSKDFFFFSV